MAKQQFDPNDAKLLALEIEKIYKRMGQLSPFKSSVHTINELKEGLEEARDMFMDWQDGIGDIEAGFKAILNEVKATNNSFTSSKRNLSSLSSISSQLRDHQLGINQLSSNQLTTLKSKLDSELKSLSVNAKGLADEEVSLLNQARISELTAQQQQRLDRIRILSANVNGLLQDRDSLQQQLNAKLQEEIKNRETIEKKLGVTGGILRGISKIPILGDLVDTNEALHVAESTIETTESGVKGLGAAIGNLGKQVISGLLNPANLVLGAFTLMGKVLSDVDKGAGEYAKSMNVTYSEALNVRGEMQSIAASSGDVALNSSRLQETLMAVGKEMGSNAKLNEADLITFTKLREQAGYTNEELMGIQKLSLVNNKTLEANTKEILGAAAAYNGKNKLALNEKQILKDVNSASSALKLSLGGSVTQLTNAAAKAREFGLSLEQTEKIAESLLNFESSIESELSAELLTGRNLNLEQARLLALNGKTAEAATEIAKQVGTSVDFARMNVIQQEAIAKAAGMNRKELADSLIDKESLAKLNVKDAKSAQDAYNQLKASGMSEMEIQKRLGDKKLADQYEQQSAQDRFNQSVEKLKDIFVSLAEPILQIVSPIADFVGLLSSLGGGILPKIIGGFVALKALSMSMMLISKSKAAFDLLSLGYQTALHGVGKKDLTVQAARNLMKGEELVTQIGIAAAWAVANPFKAALGVGIAAAAVGTIHSLMKDGEIDTEKGPVLFGDFGSVQLNPRDKAMYGADGTIKVGTDLLKENTQTKINPYANNPQPQQTTQTNHMETMVNKIEHMFDKLGHMFAKHQDRPVVVHSEIKVDGEKIATASNNSNRKNSFAIS